ncbi:(Fe-S)-binding protein [Corynebacterium hansenii]|uniref:(Fe-S)-binding protein n=1 Tax=Corynebacterium hansenii TaxID=394964 RepID=A0ABV7ZJ92_9CORY|nr:(Fe-S)-binding protein [Corynebacterium hansenii]WJY99557.1 Lactate utilization protein A [Corynebacterium hansenii]
MKVALFATCVGDVMFPSAVQATAAVLTRLGCDVVFPEKQTCCGQMHVNTGYQEEALPQIDAYAGVFADPSIDYVVAPSGSCAGAVRHQHPMIAARFGTAAQADAARTCAGKTLDLSEFIVDVAGVTDVGAWFPHRVTYHSTCHSLRVLHVGDRPLKLLRAVEGIDLVDLPAAEECCGFGGTFSVKNAETSAAMVADKVGHIESTGAEFVTAGDASCLLNIGGSLRKRGGRARALHIAEILASTHRRPYQADGGHGDVAKQPAQAPADREGGGSR